ncbi:hypothetical protein N7582_005621 [Saccharomyces uvarum]|uniref:MADS-box domain-containing protein n=1 Tax=Saccharomyces uvarum TaxID=230603 RepID=A0AA35NLQ8_SACUV|nr:hypothetical protein N7582_005621 [Saccharomyces uvarum]CAI4053026.1 hypothetical protein SUVC_16G1930 [Saccharomyces uvarum]
MGRRKIEIQRISDDRNRAVTFIKRKAGLFKKAHELSVLCQVDIAVIILGSNNTFYEFSSVDTDDLIDHYQNDKNLLHEVKEPSDYGDFQKNASVNINQELLRSSIANKPSKQNITPMKQVYNDDDEEDEEEEEGHTNLQMEQHANTRSSGGQVSNTQLKLLSPTALISKMDGNDHSKRHPENALPPLQRLKRLKPDPLQINNRSPQQQQQQQQQQGIPRPYHNNMYNLNQPSSSSSSPSTMDFPKLPSFQNSSSNTRRPPISISPIKYSKPFTASNTRTPKQDHKLDNSNNDNSGYSQSSPNSLEDSVQHTVKARRKMSVRPVLRVRIPNNNFSCNSAITSEPSSASSTSGNGNSLGSSQILKGNKTSRSGKASPLSASASGPLTLQKGNNGRVVIKLPNANTSSTNNTTNSNSNHHHPYSFGNGSSPLFSATQPYIATPLQPSNIPGGPFQQNTSSFLAQRQAQQYQQIPFKKQSQPAPLTTTLTGRPPTFSGPENSNGPPTGSLPSKFVHDLMSNSPNVSSMPMFSDWAMGPNSARPIHAVPGNTNSASSFPPIPTNMTSNPNNNNPNSNNNYYNNAEEVPASGAAMPDRSSDGDISNHPNPNTYDVAASSYNGNTGLTPYINTTQTPLGTKFFNFSTDISGEKNSSKI